MVAISVRKPLFPTVAPFRGDSDSRQRLLVAVAASMWLAALLVADIAVGSQTVVLAVLFAVCPLIAATLLGPRATGAFAAAALVATAMSPWWDSWQGNAKYSVRLINAFLICLGAVVIAMLREHRERRLIRVTEIARAAQQAMLPDLPARLGPVSLQTRYQSATAEASIGGDLFDAVDLGDRVRIVVGDVRGKGLEAVGHAARTIRAFRQFASSEPDLASVAARMSAYLAPFLAAEDFVTALLVEIDGAGRVTVVGCGHPPPFVCKDRDITLLSAAESPPLGLSEPLGLAPAYRKQSITVGPSDRLLLYTDGLIEARDALGREIESDQIARCLEDPSADSVLDTLLATLVAHASPAGLADDLALVLIEFTGTVAGGVAGGVRTSVADCTQLVAGTSRLRP
jgi:hypothetical protein